MTFAKNLPFALLAFAFAVLAIASLAFALFFLQGCATDCGITKTYETKRMDCQHDAGSWRQLEECMRLVDCEYGVAPCNR